MNPALKLKINTLQQNFLQQTAKDGVKVKLLSLKCDFAENYFEFVVCKFKPTRDGIGNVTILAKVDTLVNDIYLHVQVFYKYTRFEPFMINVKINYCDTASSKFILKALY